MHRTRFLHSLVIGGITIIVALVFTANNSIAQTTSSAVHTLFRLDVRAEAPFPSDWFTVPDQDGTFQAAQNFGVGRSAQSVAVGDFNGDGRPDLAANYSYGVSVLINNTRHKLQ